MYENLIHNYLRMIPWDYFWEPVTKRQKCIKWTIILLLLSLGISIFLFKLDDIRACEYACNNPVIVEAERKIIRSSSFFTGYPHYNIYLSYTYKGVKYEDIYYYMTKNEHILWDGIETLTVAVDPNNPGMPIRNMFNEGPVVFAIVLWSLGLTMLVYGIAVEFPSFRNWRVSCANRPYFFSRPYGKPVKHTDAPDYAKDFVLIFIPILFSTIVILVFLFPYALSP